MPVATLHRLGVGVLGVVCATLLLTRIAFACPSCPTTNTVRWIVLGDGFWFNAVVAVLPFIVIGAVSYFAHGIGRRSRS